MIEVEQKTGQNFYSKSEPILNKMFQDFQEQNLNKEWQFKLEDYLPQPEPQSRVPLPEQPQPNPAVVQAPTAMNTGLTPAEQTLLSEEEKILAKEAGLSTVKVLWGFLSGLCEKHNIQA